MANHSSSKHFGSSPHVSTPQKFSATKPLAAVASVVLLMSALAVALPAQAAEANVAVADGYTVSTVPNKSYGTTAKISVGFDSADSKSGYLKFMALGPIASTDQLKIELTVLGGTAGVIKAATVASSWSEGTLTYASAPEAGKSVGSVAVSGGKEKVALTLSGISASDGTVSIKLDRSSGLSRIASREASGAQPTITVTKNATTVPTTPPVASTPPVGTTPPTPPVASEPSTCQVSAKLVPSCGVLYGASANPLSGESWDQALVNFEKTSGRTMDIAHYYKRGQSAMFPNTAELNRQDETGKNRILFYNWKPSGMTWRKVADGAADSYLKQLAAHMKANADKPFYLSLNAEMEDEVNTAAGSGQTATDYRDFFRHVTQVLRANGASNMVTVMNYTGIQKWGEMSWFKDLYPGNDVVDWIAQDPYAFGKPPVWLTDFAGLVNRTSNSSTWPGFYNWAAANYPDKPQMLGEWGVDEDPAYPTYKADFFKTAGAQLAKLPKLKALVYWDSSGVEPSGNVLSVGDTLVTSKTTSLAAYKSFANSDLLTKAGASYLK